jgi:hypothetical protein
VSALAAAASYFLTNGLLVDEMTEEHERWATRRRKTG